MKKYFWLIAACLLVFSGMSFAVESNPYWKVSIYGNGQDLGGVKYHDVIIGVGQQAETLPAPPLPPHYSVNMGLTDIAGNLKSKDIRHQGQTKYFWVIAIDPHGNIMPPNPRSSMMSWFPTQLGPGKFELRKGYNGEGEIVVSDMKSVSWYQVTGGEGKQYFTVVYTTD